MQTRIVPILLAIVMGPATLAAAETATVTVTGLRHDVADCYEDAGLEGKFREVKKEEWPGSQTVEDSGQALRFNIGGRRCWIDRNEVDMANLPKSEECVSNGQVIGTRGQGSSPKCEKKKR